MYGNYINILAKSCQDTFQTMSDSKISKIWVKQDDQLSSVFSVAHLVSFKDSNSDSRPDLIAGFSDEPMAVFVASEFARKMNLPDIETIDETAADILNEFMNIAMGNAISEWRKAGLGSQFEHPVMVQNKDFGDSSQSITETHQITLELQGDLTAPNRTFDHVNLKISFTNGSQGQTGEGKRILVAEDSGVMGKMLCAALQDTGFVVELAKDGMEAIAKHKEFQPDLTVMDLYMPKVDGLDAIVQIRESAPDAKFIVLTSSSKKDEVVTARTLNVVDYVLKTGKMEEIVGKVKDALG